MKVSLILTTIECYLKDGTLSFYGENATAVLANNKNRVPFCFDENYLGRSAVMPWQEFFNICTPLVKLGYKFKIHKGTRLCIE